jgi:hypothetical protein
VIAQVSASSGAQLGVLLPSGGLGHSGSSAGRLLVPPSWETPFLVGIGAEESTPATAPLTGRPATTPAYATPTSAQLSCRPLNAACSPMEAVGKTTGPWAELSFASAGRGAENGSGAGRFVEGSMQPPESDESNSLALRLPAVARGAFRETEVSRPAEPGWRPLGWPVGRSPDPLALAAASASLLFFSATMSCFSYRQTAADCKPSWTFRKASAFSPLI